MKKVIIRFTVSTNDNVYFATSTQAMIKFVAKNDFCVDREWDISSASITEQSKAEKCGRGVYCILD